MNNDTAEYILQRLAKLEERFELGPLQRVCGHCQAKLEEGLELEHWKRCPRHPVRRVPALDRYIRVKKFPANTDLLKILHSYTVEAETNRNVAVGVRHLLEKTKDNQVSSILSELRTLTGRELLPMLRKADDDDEKEEIVDGEAGPL